MRGGGAVQPFDFLRMLPRVPTMTLNSCTSCGVYVLLTIVFEWLKGTIEWSYQFRLLLCKRICSSQLQYILLMRLGSRPVPHTMLRVTVCLAGVVAFNMMGSRPGQWPTVFDRSQT